MNALHICIFGGTTEGRLLAEFLSKNNIEADLFVATEYGEQFVKNFKHINIHQKRLDKKEMINLFLENKYDFVVDATHPFAKIVSENIISSSCECNVKYVRVIRESFKNNYCKYFDNDEEVVEYLMNKVGNILLTTGSKALDKYTKINNYAERIFVRILPMEDSLKRSIELGYFNKNIICMQGPFSEELNIAMLNSTNAKYVVTKESSNSGGFGEKVNSCIKTGAECLVIRKPNENGLTLNELFTSIKNIM